MEELLHVAPGFCARSHSWLASRRIAHIVDAARVCAPNADGVARLDAAVDDRPHALISAHFDAAADFCRQAWSDDAPVLFACVMGRSRSATLAAAVLMRERGLGWMAALECVRERRPTAKPNSGFLEQLRLYETELERRRSSRARRLLARLSGLLLRGEARSLSVLPSDVFAASSDGARVIEDGLLAHGELLAINQALLSSLWSHARAAWAAERAEGAAPSLDAASAHVVLLSAGQCTTTWNQRKHVLLEARRRGENVEAQLLAESSFVAAVLRSFPKAHEAWAHRRWLALFGPETFQLLDEVRLCLEAHAGRPANYHAGRHLAFVVKHHRDPAALAETKEVLRLVGEASQRDPSDVSLLYALRAALQACGSPSAQQLAWSNAGDALERFPWLESLWAHRRALLELVGGTTLRAELEWLAAGEPLAGRPPLGSEDQMRAATRNICQHARWLEMRMDPAVPAA